ncbi:endonuclease/exonuclease/phosphatase family protein [Nocardia pseudobrasiliensis]|uniref:Vancomycin resistance protein VanJ n=1 Tax=Nocardia pseudobrasiliensis TaxID=45979 RepID=A0A370IDW1_9NOCA|nr:endonuclease/exonuclease/phosphatase family protein [Nocardia pseudobrasiliensis]RDI68895.1 vancomycin resistance protein VanJ [Nocardia pseudobrasiliensis]
MRANAALVGAGALLTLLLVGHRLIPDVAGLGVLLDSAAPWLGLGVPVLALTALACRSRLGIAAAVVPLLAWGYAFGWWWGGPDSTGPGQLVVVTQNMSAANDAPGRAIRELRATGADLIALQEVSGQNARAAENELSDDYPYHAAVGTVALWSRYPVSGVEPADVGAGWRRGLRARVDAPGGTLTAYVVHLPSIRLGDNASRDHGLATLSRELSAEKSARVVVLGDFNTTATDRHWHAFAPGYHDSRQAAGGPQFTWPAALPVVGPDHILIRGLRAATSSVLHTPGSDHRGLAAGLAVRD